MNEELKEQLNIDTEDNDGLSQEKIEDLFKSLGESYINEMLERSGLSEEDPEADDAAPAEDTVADNKAPEAEDTAPSGDSEAAGGPEIDEAPEPAEEQPADGEAEEPAADTLAAGGELEPEHIGHLLKMLGEDMINDMLLDAGLSEEDLEEGSEPAEESQADDSTEKPEADTAAESVPKIRKKRRKGKAKRRFLLLAIAVGIVLLVFAVNQISMNVSINEDDPIQYSEENDEISALEGTLIVNDVHVSVPTTGDEEYSISYTWAEDDEKYPSVPHAITAVYPGEEDTKLYTISLYRNETVRKKAMPKGKKADNWFDDWEAVSEGDVLQKPLKSGDISGFYIYPQMNEEGTGPTTDYNNYSYYFAVKNKGGVSIYILEGVCLDENAAAVFPQIMDSCIKSITVQKEKQETDTQETDAQETDTPETETQAD